MTYEIRLTEMKLEAEIVFLNGSRYGQQRSTHREQIIRRQCKKGHCKPNPPSPTVGVPMNVQHPTDYLLKVKQP